MSDVTPESIRRKRRKHRLETAASRQGENAARSAFPLWMRRKAKYVALACVVIAALFWTTFVAIPPEIRLSAAAAICGVFAAIARAYHFFRIRVPSSTPLPALRVTAERVYSDVDAAREQFAVVGDLPLDLSARHALFIAAQAGGCRLICVTGDVVKQSSPRGWRDCLGVLKSALAPRTQCCFTPGNHDIDHNLLGRDRRFYRHYFGLGNYVVKAGQFDLVFLDSADLAITDAQAGWLASLLSDTRQAAKQAIIFTHAPPREPPAIDDHCLRTDSTVRFASAIEGAPVAAIFCGHVHRFFNYAWAGTTVYVGGCKADASAPNGGLSFFRVQARGGELKVSVEKA